MSLKKAFGTDKAAIENGAWIDICTNEDGSLCRFRVKRTNQQNREFTKAMTTHSKMYEGQSLSAHALKQAENAMIRVIADTVLVDWENVVEYRTEFTGFPTEDGKPPMMEYNRDNVVFILTDLPDLVELILKKAGERSTFEIEQEVADEKK